MKRAALIIGAALVGLYALGLVAGPPAPPTSRSETVLRRCAEEFPADTNARTECYTLIMARDAAADHRQRVDRAGR